MSHVSIIDFHTYLLELRQKILDYYSRDNFYLTWVCHRLFKLIAFYFRSVCIVQAHWVGLVYRAAALPPVQLSRPSSSDAEPCLSQWALKLWNFCRQQQFRVRTIVEFPQDFSRFSIWFSTSN